MATQQIKKILPAIGANTFSFALTICIQVFNIPLYLSYWSAEYYGSWLLISAMPIYLTLLDFGMGPVVATDMVIRIETGRAAQSKLLGGFLLGFSGVASLTISILGSLCAYFAHFVGVLPLTQAVSLALLIAGTALAMQLNSFEAPLRAANRYADAVWMLNTVRAAEWSGGAVALILNGGMIQVAGGMLIARLISSCAFVYVMRSSIAAHSTNIRLPSKYFIRKFLRPALRFLSFPLSNALALQGVSIIIGSHLGGGFLVAFTAARTFTRMFVQVVAVLTKSIWPLLTIKYASGDFLSVSNIYLKTQKIILGLGVIFLLFSMLAGASIVEFWSKSKVLPGSNLLIVLSFSAVLAAAWQLNTVLLMATNKHGVISTANTLTSTILVLVVLLGCQIDSVGVVYFSLIAAELIMLVYSHKKIQHML